VGGLQGVVHSNGQDILDGIQVHCVFQPGRESGDGPFGVVVGPVEPAVDRVLDPAAEWAEKCCGEQGGARHRHRRVERQYPGRQQHDTRVAADEQASHDAYASAADDPVDVIQPIPKGGTAVCHRDECDGPAGYRIRAPA
jgi:hypothetical protein